MMRTNMEMFFHPARFDFKLILGSDKETKQVVDHMWDEECFLLATKHPFVDIQYE